MQFTTYTLAALACIGLVAADFAAVLQDAKNADTALTKLNNDAQKTSGTSYIQALGIDSDAKAVIKAVDQGTTDGNALTETVTEAQAQQLLDSLTATEVTAKAASDRLVALQPSFQKIGVSGIAKGDIQNLQSSVSALGKVVIAKAPASYVAQAQALIAKYNADLAAAAAAYGA